MAEAAAINSKPILFMSKCFNEKSSMPCAIIFGINMLIPFPRSAMIVSRTILPEYGLSKLNILGLLSRFFGE